MSKNRKNDLFNIQYDLENVCFFHFGPAIPIKVYHEEYFKVGSKKCIPSSQGQNQGQTWLTCSDL